MRIKTVGGSGGGAAPSTLTAASVVMGPDFGSVPARQESHMSSTYQNQITIPVNQEHNVRAMGLLAGYKALHESALTAQLVNGYRFNQESKLTAANSLASTRLMLQESSMHASSWTAAYPMSQESDVVRYDNSQTYQARQEQKVSVTQTQAYNPPVLQEATLSRYISAPIYRANQESDVTAYSNSQTYGARQESDVAVVEYEMSQIMAVKDAWCDTNVNALGNCVDVANHNSTYLLVLENSIVTSNHTKSYIGFNLANFPAGATVTSASLVLRPVAGGGPSTVEVLDMTSAAEGWGEATIVCSNAPAPSVVVARYAATTSTAADTVVNITSAAATIQNRMGSALTFSVLLRTTGSTGVEVRYESKDNPSGTTVNGPRLRLKFRVPV